MERRLAAILAIDVVGYSREMSRDEEGTVARMRELREEFLAIRIADHKGRIFKTMGDGVLVEFQSAVEAVRCAAEIQKVLRAQNDRLPLDLRMETRIGVNSGDVIVEGDDLLGDGVNVASRLEQIAEPGGVSVSGVVYEQAADKTGLSFVDLGYKTLKNIERPVHVYRLRGPQDEAKRPAAGLFDFGEVGADRPAITGGCLCGTVRYEASAQPLATGYCHCSICQRFTGSAFSVWTAFKADSVRFTKGMPKLCNTSLVAERGFCSDCGGALTYRLKKPKDSGILVVFTSSLDEARDFAPASHGGIESQMPWLDIHDDLSRTRSEESLALRTAWESVGVTNPADWKPTRNDQG